MAAKEKSTSELEALSSEMDKALASARLSGIAMIVLTLASCAGIGYWLNYAQNSFITGATPEAASAQAVLLVQDALPRYAPEVKQKLIDMAPSLLDKAEENLNSVPDEFADAMMRKTGEELDRLTPQVETELLAALKTALTKARDARPAGVSDEDYIKALIDTLADTYGEESIKLIDEVRSQYTRQGADVLAYLEFLADNKGLDRRQEAQRQALVTFLTIANRAKASQPQN